MGRLHTKVADCEYKEYDRRLTEQVINGLDNVDMIGRHNKGTNSSERYQ